ncbi:hypothetical protein GGR57DRAFT_494530 [Xylariaceae sp. FL1272]|nr:hypothetical protein GGR57DRAFT_494530 [Xylariaceae sp. FL1272]
MPISSLRNFISQTWPPRPTFTDDDVPVGSRAGRVFMVTEGNVGIGYELCKMLFKSDARVYMASRSKDKAENAIASITAGASVSDGGENQPGVGELRFLELDLNDLKSVKRATERFSQCESKLDVLWNNAGPGAFIVPYGQRTVQGFEPLIGVHCIATLLFTTLLLPQLKAAALAESGNGKTRVVWLASGLVDSAAVPNGINFSLLHDGIQDRIQNYAMSKAGCWLLDREFARRHKEDGIAESFANTPRPIVFIMKRLLYHPKFGAYTELFAGLSPEIKILPREHELRRQDIVKASAPEEDVGLAYGERLWNWCATQWSDQKVDVHNVLPRCGFNSVMRYHSL